jgi:hypothetical protein
MVVTDETKEHANIFPPLSLIAKKHVFLNFDANE